MKHRLGFTVLELLVVVSLIGILAAAVILTVSEGSAAARDAERKADLRSVQAAIELYRQQNGRYPAGCNDTAASWEGEWSGEPDTDYNCPGNSGEYIIGLAPDFIPVLPRDPKRESDDAGFAYTTNPAGTVYKFISFNSAETDLITNTSQTADSEFARCGDMTLLASECQLVPTSPSGGGTGYVLNSSGNTPTHCTNASQYRDDLAVWGGFAPGGGSPYRDLPKAREYYSEQIRCK